MCISRFIVEQKISFDIALSEIRKGQKETHWVWFVFPRLRCLGKTATSDYFGISDLNEAKEYLNSDYLYHNLITASKALADMSIKDITQFFGDFGSKFVLSSITLFYFASESIEDKIIFMNIINKYFDGKLDILTLANIAPSIIL